MVASLVEGEWAQREKWLKRDVVDDIKRAVKQGADVNKPNAMGRLSLELSSKRTSKRTIPVPKSLLSCEDRSLLVPLVLRSLSHSAELR